jgi:hypothetical protein
MKTMRLLTIPSMLVLLMSFTFVNHEFIWNYYKISVELPDDFKVVTNTDNEFESVGEGMHLYMYLFDDGDVSLDQMDEATLKLAHDLHFDMKDDEYPLDYNGFKGKYFLGYKDGHQVMLAGIINPKNATNFFVAITFSDGDHVAEKDGVAILNSLENE